ncbi:MAG: ABC transporter permease [Lachnospiraceae bacterium]|nr:ABC transporter permease [Lachnospiraceae bacterium]
MAKNKTENKKSAVELFGEIIRHPLFIPVLALAILVIYNLLKDPSFFAIRFEGGKLMGNPISILDFGSELALLAMGMTLVTAATGGQDISVGANIVIASSVILTVLDGNGVNPGTLVIGLLAACVVCMIFGAFNGMLVAQFKIQPMIATLILFTAGRDIGRLLSGGTSPRTESSMVLSIGSYIEGIPVPTPLIITIICIVIMFLVLKFTTLGLYTQAIGINESSSRLNGINPKLMKIVTFIILGLCVAIAGFIKVGRTGTVDYDTTALNIEMDAILAVAIGGNALSGGKFNMGASLLGAYVIQFLMTTLNNSQIDSRAFPAYKALVVVALVVLSAPVVREKLNGLGKKLKPKKKVEVKEVG